jgi:Bacterial nucleoid DNA-binding protein
MNKKGLIEYTCEKLKNDGVAKPVTIPRRTFFISDNDGNECKFHVKQIDKRAAYTQQDVSAIVDAFLSSIEDVLKNGEQISIYGFGVLEPHYRAARSTVIPGTKDRVEVESRYVPKFSPGNNLKLAVKLWEVSKGDGDS